MRTTTGMIIMVNESEFARSDRRVGDDSAQWDRRTRGPEDHGKQRWRNRELGVFRASFRSTRIEYMGLVGRQADRPVPGT